MGFRDWLIVIVLSSTGTFLGMVFTIVAPSLPLVAAHFGGGSQGAFVAQWILTMPSIGVIIGGPLMGWFVERFNARGVLFNSFLVFAVAGIGAIFGENQYILLLFRFVLGISAVGQVTGSLTIIGDLFTDKERGSAVGLQNAIATGLTVLATLAAGIIAQRYGWRASSGLYAISLIALLVGVLVIPLSNRRDTRKSEAKIAALIPLIPIYALITMSMIIAFLTSSEMPLLLARDGFSDPVVISRVIGAGTGLFMIGSFLYGLIRARLGIRRTFMLGLFFHGVGVLGLSMTHGLLWLALSGLVLNLGSGIQTPNLNHWVLDRAPVEVRGRAVGLMFSAQFLGPFLNSALIAPEIRNYGIENILMFIGILIAVMLVVTALGTRPYRSSAAAGVRN